MSILLLVTSVVAQDATMIDEQTISVEFDPMSFDECILRMKESIDISINPDELGAFLDTLELFCPYPELFPTTANTSVDGRNVSNDDVVFELIIDGTPTESSPIVSDDVVTADVPLVDAGPLPTRPMTRDDLTTTEIPLVDDLTTAEMPLVDDLTTAEIPLVDDLTTAEIPLVDDRTTAEIPIVDDLTTAEIPIVDDVKMDEGMAEVIMIADDTVIINDEVTGDHDSMLVIVPPTTMVDFELDAHEMDNSGSSSDHPSDYGDHGSIRGSKQAASDAENALIRGLLVIVVSATLW